MFVFIQIQNLFLLNLEKNHLKSLVFPTTILESQKVKVDTMKEEILVMKTKIVNQAEVDEMRIIVVMDGMRDEGEILKPMTVVPDIIPSMIIEIREVVNIELSVTAEIIMMIIESHANADDTRESVVTHQGKDLHDHYQEGEVVTLMITNTDIGIRLKRLSPRGDLDLIQSQDQVDIIITTHLLSQVAIITIIQHRPQVVTIAITTIIIVTFHQHLHQHLLVIKSL